MPVDAVHPEYADYINDWTRCRDAFGGRRLVKARKTKYLPWLEEQESHEYNDYLMRAQWYDATERTTRGLAGAILRNDTRIEAPTLVQEQLDDVTLTGQDVHAFSQRILLEQVNPSRVGVEVTMSPDEVDDPRPYWNLWSAESITNWVEMRIQGRNQLVLVVLKEPIRPRTDDFAWGEVEDRYRVLRLTPAGDSWVYGQELWIKNPDAATKDQWIKHGEIVPSRRGQTLSRIPFTLFNASSIEASVEKPALSGLVDLNFGHYINSADYEQALSAIKPLYHFTGLEAGTKIVLGSRRAVIAEDSGGTAQILQGAEPTGLFNAMEEKKKAMSAHGGGMMETEPAKNETLGAVRIRYGGKQATLRTIATAFGVGLRSVIRDHAYWIGADEGAVQVRPNMDFIDTSLEPDQLRAYFDLLQGSAISYKTFYHLLQGGETTRPGITVDEELEELENQADEEQFTRAEAQREQMELQAATQGDDDEAA